jgi:hypothetical protein
LKYSIAILCFVLIGFGFASNGAGQPPGEPDSTTMKQIQAAMFVAAQPGPEHERLASLVGDWQQELKVWMEPGGEPVVIPGTCTNKMILGGRFLHLTAESEFMGDKTESINILGFDRRHKKYTLVGFDTFGTYYVTASGTYNDSTKTITMSGEDDDPIAGITQLYDMTLRFIDENKFVMEVIFKDEAHTKGGDPFKIVEINFTRK